jgi:arylsulfatase A-like enzyme
MPAPNLSAGRGATVPGAALLAALLAGLPAGSAAAEPVRPNFLVLVADDLGWRDVGYHDSEIRTPHLDALARAGVRLERHYVYPTCSPTRAGLLTGRNPSRFGIAGPIGDRSTQALPPDTLTLARALKGCGYATALAGKWHLGLRPSVGPRRYGFDHTYGYLHGQLDQYEHVYKNGDRTWHRNDVFIDEKGHATDLIAAEAVRFIGAKRDEPFFLHVAFSVPHYPIQEEAKWIEPYLKSIKDPSRRLYAASVAHMDAAVGAIVEALRKAGKLQSTLVLFTSDNGGQRDYASKKDYGGKHGPYPTLGDNRPLRGWKGELYEGGIRVPAFVSWPGHLRSRVVEQTTSYLDVLPTFAALAGAEVGRGAKLEGRDVRALLTGEGKAPAPPVLYWNTGRQAAVREGDWKLIVSRRGKDRAELFNLADDPQEKKDLAGEKPAQVEALRKVLAEQSKGDG